jgi:glyoxylase-like metal-dependent hydrolase (beta-lactamase superfamily II)
MKMRATSHARKSVRAQTGNRVVGWVRNRVAIGFCRDGPRRDERNVVLVTSFPAEVFGANCYLLAIGRGASCVVVDPGAGVAGRLAETLAEHELRPAAVVLTHGHFDHTASAAEVSERYHVPVYVHPADRAMLADPARGVGLDLRQIFGETFTWRVPATVRHLPVDESMRLADIDLEIRSAPGHTPGGVLIRFTDGDRPMCLSGDVLFAGSIGRTDLATGDPAAMRATLRDQVLSLPDNTVVLPGHGPATTIAAERVGNPYLSPGHLFKTTPDLAKETL